MTVNELRLGNLVLLDNKKCYPLFDKEIFEVIGINKRNVSIESFDKSDDIVDFGQKLKYIKPIPLTEEWFLKFEKFEQQYRIGQRKIFTHKIHKAISFEILSDSQIAVYFNDELIKFVKYLHVWQNLYFALTQTELTIKEL